ncbi:hypothetical protein BASA81_002098 [Batrachochytrium salamandrivorans]|nr:hypothetical protein BASA81_002098 [Batrachochytrium salamandrivorans]
MWLLLLLLAWSSEAHELCGITCFFNPLGHSSRKLNYLQARQWSKRQGLFLTVVELAFGEDAEFEIQADDDLTRVIHVKTPSTSNVLWHKEALLNVALRSLKTGDCPLVVWLDSDVVLEDGWMEATKHMLTEHAIGQPFTKLVRLPKGIFSPYSYWSEARERRMGQGFREGQLHFGIANQGHTGFAWAARRSALDSLGGLYDKAVVGGFDSLLTNALWNPRCETRMNKAMQKDFEHQWAINARRHFPFLGQINVTIRAAAFWHGEIKDRNYQDRHLILLEHSFDPQTHVAVGAGGELVWTLNAPTQLQRDVFDMFTNRQEDGQVQDEL